MTEPLSVSASQSSKVTLPGQPLRDGDTATDPQVLIGLLEQQRSVYQQLAQLAQEQGRLVRDGASEPLLAVLAQRQQRVDELTQINIKMEPYRSRWEQLYNRLSMQDRQRVAGLVQEVQGLLSTIIEQDNHDRQQLEQSKSLIHNELGRVTQAGAAMQAYKVRPASGGGHLTDRQG